jgi:hypothetical protein
MNKIISKTTSSTNIITTIINSQHLSTINMKQQLQKQSTSSNTISSTIISINTFEALPLTTANIQAVKVISTTQIIHSHFPTTLKIPSLSIYSVPLTTSGIKSSAFISTNTFKALPLTTANTQAIKVNSATKIIHSYFPTTLKIPSLNIDSILRTTKAGRSTLNISNHKIKSKTTSTLIKINSISSSEMNRQVQK